MQCNVMDFPDSMDDIEQEPGSVDQATTAYGSDRDDDLTTTEDENDSGDENGEESDSDARDGGGGSGMGGGVLVIRVLKFIQ